MVFASPIFLFVFFPIVLIGNFILKGKLRNIWLFLASFVFYAWSGLAYGALILISIAANYAFGLFIGKYQEQQRKKRIVLILSVIFNLGLLGFFKYFNFFTDLIENFLGLFSPGMTLSAPFIPLPVGISFFTFQIMSYVIDAYWGHVSVQRSYIDLGLYLMLFPQLIAGPIVRYIDVEREIGERTIRLEDVYVGLKRFIVGLAKKALIANLMGQIADYAFQNVAQINMPLAWLGILAYTLQIFFDFCAYSDMAIGMGRILGFHFIENFNYPYISKSIQEFWRRWHISLSTWFRDYLYIPLGGNRRGNVRTYINLGIVFFATGLWHGAAWNFVVWGLYHGFFLIIERLGFSKQLKRMPVVGHLYVIVIVMIGWVLFRANNLSEALLYLGHMFSADFSHMENFYLQFDGMKLAALLMGILFSMPVVPWLAEKIGGVFQRGKVWIRLRGIVTDTGYAMLFLASASFISGSSFNPFIYYRF